MKAVRTRFAPSPTGMQHIGGFRTAMYAWLLARHFGGQFLLRIEDTDQKRFVPGSVKYLIESLHWLGIDYDEGPSREDLRALGEDWDGAPDVGGPCGPYIQSRRVDHYKKYAEQLIASGHAYRCDCTAEMLEQERLEQMARKERPGYSGYCRTRNVSADTEHVVRLRIPERITLSVDDVVRGRLVWENPPLTDAVLIKSDGVALYHLASVVDDHLMEISHVMRGDEWLATTPIHLMLYDALGWERPIFCHLAHIMGNDGKKLSKRSGALGVDEFKNTGYLPEALLNFIVLIGWSPGEGNNQEVFTREELIKAFSIEHLGASGGTFDPNKLSWMNGVYIRNLSDAEFTKRVMPDIEASGLKFDQKSWELILPHVRERMKALTEVVPMVDFLFMDQVTPDAKELVKNFSSDRAKEILDLAAKRIDVLPEFSVVAVDAAMRELVTETGEKLGHVFHLLRIAVTGKTITPPLFESMVALGREKTKARLLSAIK